MKPVKTLIVLALSSFALTSCSMKDIEAFFADLFNGGGKSGTTESDFYNAAQEAIDKDNPYTYAEMSSYHTQKSGSTTQFSYEASATYAREGGTWEMITEDIDYSYKAAVNPSRYIEITMIYYSSLVSTLQSAFGTPDKLTYSIGATSSIIYVKTNFDYSGYHYSKVECKMQWDQYGQLKLFNEVDNLTASGTNFTVTENIQFTYSK